MIAVVRLGLFGAAVLVQPAAAQSVITPPPACSGQANCASLSPAAMFDLAAALAKQNRLTASEQILEALTRDKNPDYRREARFRLGEILEAEKRFTEAAILFRAILDEQPQAQRVRLELAKVLALSGRENEARRQLRAAQAGGLPPDVARVVNQFQAALRSFRPISGSLELGIAPSSNINRATSATTLNSTIGPLELSQDARAQSGIGVNLSGQGSLGFPVSKAIRLIAQLSTQNTVYRASRFDDDTVAGAVGADLSLGRGRVRISVGPTYRLYGMHPYTMSLNTSANWLHPWGTRSQIELQSEASAVTYKTNPLQDGGVFSETGSLEHAVSTKFGGKLSAFVQRITARDPGYATTTAGGSILLYRELGKMTVYGSVTLSHLGSDARLFLYTDRRKEWLCRGNVGAVFRQIQVAGFAPVVRLNYERNNSTVGIYNYHRFNAELAITRAF